MLIVHIILGYRRLQDIKYYKDDLMVKRTLGLNTLPSAPTLNTIITILVMMMVCLMAPIRPECFVHH